MMSDKKKKAPMIHTQKLFQGLKTAEEVYQELAVNAPCAGCGAPGLTKLDTLVSLKDLQDKAPHIVVALARQSESGVTLPITKTVYGPMVCVARMVACKSCTPTAERAAAKGEREWSKRGMTVTCEIKRGPGVDIPVFQVPGDPGPSTPDMA